MTASPGMKLVANFAYHQYLEMCMAIRFLRPHIKNHGKHAISRLVKSPAIDVQLFSINDIPLAEESKL